MPPGKVLGRGDIVQVVDRTPTPLACRPPPEGLRDLEKIKLRALLVYGSVFGVAPRITYNEYAPLGVP
jgi:hypothetical protein